MSGIFDKYKKKTETKSEKSYRRYLVLGSDLYALRTYYFLRAKFGANEVALLADKKLNEEDLHLFGPSSLRGNENVEMLRKYFPAFELTSSDKANLFLKEGEWKAFGGRSKGEVLLSGEEHFVPQRVFYNERDFFDTALQKEIFEQNQKEIFVRTPFKIYRQEPTDLVERTHWKIECVGGEIFECEHLIWAYAPERFMRTFESKSLCSSAFIETCEKFDSTCALYVRFHSKEKLIDMLETLFIPLSYTHEWGHFIGEWFDQAEGQRGEFVHFIDKEQMNEEEVGKRIRHLKKSLEKIFKNYDEKKVKEFVSLSENAGCRKVITDQKIFAADDFKNLFFIGENAIFPLNGAHIEFAEDSYRTTGFARAVLSIEFLIRNNS